MSNKQSNKLVIREMAKQDQEKIFGGASAFLKGNMYSTLRSSGQSAGQSSAIGNLKLAAKSQPVLDCWHECTYNISSC